ncbi:MAG: hypothetical protein K8W52_05355 [Deltaproteobacteria bacterium]|nr:hypothetical protein [Deltaproteobacteria bacterium]
MTAVITGVGVVSAFGVGRERFFAGLRGGDHAIRPIAWFDATTFPVRVAGEVPIEVAPVTASRDRKVGFALAAASEAWRQGGCGDAERDAPRVIARRSRRGA